MTDVARSELRPETLDARDDDGRPPMVYVVELRRGEVRGTSAPALVLLDLRALVRGDHVARHSISMISRVVDTRPGHFRTRLRGADELHGVRPQVPSADLAGLLDLASRVLEARRRLDR